LAQVSCFAFSRDKKLSLLALPAFVNQGTNKNHA